MRKSSWILLLTFPVFLFSTPCEARPSAEAFEIGEDRVSDLPRGKEADGIIGDFVLRNGRVEALVSGNLPFRRANMLVHMSETTPGCLYDLSVRGSENDQLTCVAPGDLRGSVSGIRILDAGAAGGQESGAAAIVVERTAARGRGLAQRHEYTLGPDAAHLVIVSTYENQRKDNAMISPEPWVMGLTSRLETAGIVVFNSQDPMDRQGYAYTFLGESEPMPENGEVQLAPGAKRSYLLAVAPGRSPVHALGALAPLTGPTGVLRGSVLDGQGQPIVSASLNILFGVDDQKNETWIPAYPGPDGRFELVLPPGEYSVTVEDLGRPTVTSRVTIDGGGAVQLDVKMEAASRVRFSIRDRNLPTYSLPCKVQFIGLENTEDPYLGVTIRAHGCHNQYHSETGDFGVAIPPGKYRVVVTRGIEYDHHERVIDLAAGQEVQVKASLERVVDTRGWVSTDYHNHSTPSGDNYCGVDDRIINLAAEQIEFAPATEHNRIYDWAPHIRKLGLENEVATTAGTELTGPGSHLNAFPLTPVPYTQDNGAPVWVTDPRLNAIVLRNHQGGHPDRWVHLNHPNLGRDFRDRNSDGKADGGYRGLVTLLNAAEIMNYAASRASKDNLAQGSLEILLPRPAVEFNDQEGKRITAFNRAFAWMQFLNQGRNFWAVAVSDAHTVFDMGVGGWRTYVPSSSDRPDALDVHEIITNSKAGRMVLTNGPYLEVRGQDGALPGATTRASDAYALEVRVQTNTWVHVDRIQVLVNGRAPEDLDFRPTTHPDLFVNQGAEKFRASIAVPLTEDAHLIVVAAGESATLEKGYGLAWQGQMRPCAFTNPIFVDIDGAGFQPNGDTLDDTLPTGVVPPPTSGK